MNGGKNKTLKLYNGIGPMDGRVDGRIDTLRTTHGEYSFRGTN